MQCCQSVSNHKIQRFSEIRTSVLLLLRNPWVQMKVACTFPRTCYKISCQKIGMVIGQISYIRLLVFRQNRNIHVVHEPSTRYCGTNVLSSLYLWLFKTAILKSLPLSRR